MTRLRPVVALILAAVYWPQAATPEMVIRQAPKSQQPPTVEFDELAGGQAIPLDVLLKAVYSKDAKPEGRWLGDRAIVTFDTDPWALTARWRRNGFLGNVRMITPAVFAAIPAINTLQIRGTGTFTTIRGDEGRADVARVVFTRKNAASIKWNRIDDDNIPKLADRFWAHPNFK